MTQHRITALCQKRKQIPRFDRMELHRSRRRQEQACRPLRDAPDERHQLVGVSPLVDDFILVVDPRQVPAARPVRLIHHDARIRPAFQQNFQHPRVSSGHETLRDEPDPTRA